MDAPRGAGGRPPWKEPMVWLVVAIPAASVLASVALLVTAARSSGNNDVVADPVRRTAQIQVADLAPDIAARERGLVAVLRIDGERIELLPLAGVFPRDAALRLDLQHPARARDDLSMLLQPATGGWQARQALPLEHDWTLTVGAIDRSWRLQGRLPRGQREVRLQPALVAP
ncbi:FixH family protein [Thermomonas sp.]|jgi:hypothetical protein|uniref:FixH family protein n=1 Tax=Thermomonas sp. TaxID=1971895 RepID=UPI001B58AD8E|nr:FixH family protein [Thermomonas sp.]MBK6332383.1 FixH family protein [Thermomonas sp.]MBK6416991.1 FixH family protein [Thermomonas sp.]MBK6924224.1 FixH family protein [Thermomonas sp.]MBK7204723.1 FixH family protein [Thermomonas sp.]MBK9670264.1 FixH family protein [Thermomonas sp.]